MSAQPRVTCLKEGKEVQRTYTVEPQAGRPPIIHPDLEDGEKLVRTTDGTLIILQL